MNLVRPVDVFADGLAVDRTARIIAAARYVRIPYDTICLYCFSCTYYELVYFVEKQQMHKSCAFRDGASCYNKQ